MNDERNGQPAYFATAGDNKIICTCKAILHRILIGKDVTSAIIEVSDSTTDGDGDIKLHFEGSTLMTQNKGSIEVGLVFQKGIAADHDNQTYVTYVWSPTN